MFYIFCKKRGSKHFDYLAYMESSEILFWFRKPKPMLHDCIWEGDTVFPEKNLFKMDETSSECLLRLVT